jgi:hypothetical protein
MMLRCTGLSLASCLLSGVVLAHHSWTVDYTAGDIVELEGVVKEVWYASPHARIIIEVTNDDGTSELWEGETWPAGVLARRGWSYDRVKVGDVVRIAGERAKEGRRGLHLQTISRRSDGWEAFIGLGSPDNFSLGN